MNIVFDCLCETMIERRLEAFQNVAHRLCIYFYKNELKPNSRFLMVQKSQLKETNNVVYCIAYVSNKKLGNH